MPVFITCKFIFGALPPSDGNTYLLMCIDRFTRWPKAIPIPDIAVESVAKAFVSRWVTVFGSPSVITADRGWQFESTLFKTLIELLGSKRTGTTSYHPSANRLGERFHRQLKSSLRAQADPHRWMENQRGVLFSIRATVKPDLSCSAAELVWGSTLRFPGQFVVPTNIRTNLDSSNYVDRLEGQWVSCITSPP